MAWDTLLCLRLLLYVVPPKQLKRRLACRGPGEKVFFRSFGLAKCRKKPFPARSRATRWNIHPLIVHTPKTAAAINSKSSPYIDIDSLQANAHVLLCVFLFFGKNGATRAKKKHFCHSLFTPQSPIVWLFPLATQHLRRNISASFLCRR